MKSDLHIVLPGGLGVDLGERVGQRGSEPREGNFEQKFLGFVLGKLWRGAHRK